MGYQQYLDLVISYDIITKGDLSTLKWDSYAFLLTNNFLQMWCRSIANIKRASAEAKDSWTGANTNFENLLESCCVNLKWSH